MRIYTNLEEQFFSSNFDTLHKDYLLYLEACSVMIADEEHIPMTLKEMGYLIFHSSNPEHYRERGYTL